LTIDYIFYVVPADGLFIAISYRGFLFHSLKVDEVKWNFNKKVTAKAVTFFEILSVVFIAPL